MAQSENPDFSEGLDIWIEGETIKRVSLLLIEDGIDFKRLFIDKARKHGYSEQTVANARTPVGNRSPAILIREDEALFGWIKWIKYDEGVYYKFFATELRKPSGTPEIIIRSDDLTPIWINDLIMESHEPDLPPTYE